MRPTMSDVQPPSELQPSEAARRHEQGEIELVDVREQFEYDAGHVPGSTHISMDGIAGRVDEIDKDKPVAFICLMGARSGMVADYFRTLGYDAYNVMGGFAQWFEEDLPTAPDDAKVVTH